MSSITASTDFDRVPEDKKIRYIVLFSEQVSQTLNKNLDFTTNFAGVNATATFTVANTDTAVVHGLGKIPTGYLVLGLSAAMIVYNTTAATATTLWLKSSAVGVAKLFVF